MSPDGFDDIDRALASGLSALAPEVQSGDEVLASVRPSFQRARTRSRVVKIGGTIVALVAIGSVATLAAPHSQKSHVNVSSPGSSAPDSSTRTTHRSTTTTEPTTTVPATGSISTPTTLGSNPSKNTSPTTPASVPVIVPGTIPDNHGGGPGPSSGHGRGDGSTTTTTFTFNNDIKTYSSSGGSVRVRFSHGELFLLRVLPAHGYGDRVDQNDRDRVDVSFTYGGHDRSRIDLRVENGRVVRADHSGG